MQIINDSAKRKQHADAFFFTQPPLSAHRLLQAFSGDIGTQQILLSVPPPYKNKPGDLRMGKLL